MSSQFSKSVLEKIKQEQIKPRPRWVFWLRNLAFWLVFLLAVVVGARAMAVVYYIFLEMDWRLLAQAPGPLYAPILRVFPTFWLLIFAVFVLFALLGLHHTKKGYRMRVRRLLLLNLGVTLVLGYGFFLIGDGPRFERAMTRRAPVIHSLEERRIRVWTSPEEGRLAGMVISLDGDDVLLLDDFSGMRWRVLMNEAQMWSRFELAPRLQIRIVGEQLSDEHFEAHVIGPWRKVPRSERVLQNPPAPASKNRVKK